MASQQKSDSSDEPRRSRPATTPDAREKQLVAAAIDLAEKQIREGTVSAQVLTHYLKLGSTREKLDQQKLLHETRLLEEKKNRLESEARMEELAVNAINAMRGYRGEEELPEEEIGEFFDD